MLAEMQRQSWRSSTPAARHSCLVIAILQREVVEPAGDLTAVARYGVDVVDSGWESAAWLGSESVDWTTASLFVGSAV